MDRTLHQTSFVPTQKVFMVNQAEISSEVDPTIIEELEGELNKLENRNAICFVGLNSEFFNSEGFDEPIIDFMQ